MQHRRMMGVARINLAKKDLEFYTIGPAGGVNFVLAPDRKRAYGLESAVGRYQFWTFDLDQRRVISRAEFEGRPRMSLKTSSNGRVLYIYNAGNTIDIYDARHLQVHADHHARRRRDDGVLRRTHGSRRRSARP